MPRHPRVCAWACDEGYTRVVPDAERRGCIPPFTLSPPPPFSRLYYGDLTVLPPIPRRPAPLPWSPKSEVAKVVVGAVVNRLLAKEVIQVSNLPGPAGDFLLACCCSCYCSKEIVE